ncbi:MAG: Dabb family protein, partial [Myxococcota bacterium]
IVRTVFVKLKDAYATPEERAAIRDRTLADFPKIPGVRQISVGMPADEGAEVWDLCLMVHFDTYEAIAPYSVHPIHVAYLDEVLNPRAEVKKA